MLYDLSRPTYIYYGQSSERGEEQQISHLCPAPQNKEIGATTVIWNPRAVKWKISGHFAICYHVYMDTVCRPKDQNKKVMDSFAIGVWTMKISTASDIVIWIKWKGSSHHAMVSTVRVRCRPNCIFVFLYNIIFQTKYFGKTCMWTRKFRCLSLCVCVVFVRCHSFVSTVTDLHKSRQSEFGLSSSAPMSKITPVSSSFVFRCSIR